MGRGDVSRSTSFAIWGSLLALALLAAAVRLPFSAEPPGRDQGLFMPVVSEFLARVNVAHGDEYDLTLDGDVRIAAVVGVYHAPLTLI